MELSDQLPAVNLRLLLLTLRKGSQDRLSDRADSKFSQERIPAAAAPLPAMS